MGAGGPQEVERTPTMGTWRPDRGRKGGEGVGQAVGRYIQQQLGLRRTSIHDSKVYMMYCDISEGRMYLQKLEDKGRIKMER